MRAFARSDQMPLPFAEKEYVDVRRAAKILGLSTRAVRELHRYRQIEIIDYAKGKWKRVRYQSIVDLCDRLREQYAIADRRPLLANPIFRHRDEDILPFPLVDTIGVVQAMEILGYISEPPVYNMIEQGLFEAYHFLPNSPWRISQSSLAAFLIRARKGVREENRHSSIPLQVSS